MVYVKSLKHQTLIVPTNVTDMFPDDHVCYLVERVVEGLDYSVFDRKYAGAGRPAYHPRISLKILLMGYMDSVRSSRKLAKNANESFVYVYLAERTNPNFRTLCRFRKDNPQIVKQVFSEICQFAVKHNLIDLSHLLSDGSTVKAHANRFKSLDKKTIEKIKKSIDEKIEKSIDRWIKEGIKIDEEEDKLYGDRRGPDQLHPDLSDPKKRGEIARKIADEVNKSMKENKKKEKKKEEDVDKDQRKLTFLKKLLGKQNHLSYTDPESRLMQDKKGHTEFGYNVQLVVDDKHQLIVANDARQEAHDRHSIEPNIALVEEEFGQLPPGTKLSFDAGCAKGKTTMKLTERGFDIYTPPYGSQKEKKNPYDKINFKYDEEKDTYTCPENKELRNVGSYFSKKTNERRQIYKTEACLSCPKQKQCCDNKTRQKTIHALPADKIMNQIAIKMQTPKGKEIYKNRMKVEKTYGDIKENRNFRQFLLRGITKVKTEWTLVCSAYNLKIINNLLKRKGITKKDLSRTTFLSLAC